MTNDAKRFIDHELILTKDGSYSLYLPHLDETYHSRHGALQESEYVYIEHGIDDYLVNNQKQSISILEIGFGTGLNAYLAAKWAEKNKVNVNFTTLEPFPIPNGLYKDLPLEDIKLIEILHEAPWEKRIYISTHFSILKLEQKLESYIPSSGAIDLLFFDAFGPNKQAEIWSIENLSKCYDALCSKGLLTTYCAQGQFRRNLSDVGFKINKLKGPHYKKEMTQGIKL